MNNQKLENQLNLSLDVPPRERENSSALSTGYNPLTNTWELIVKYNGNLENLAEMAIGIKRLSNQYAILVVSEDQISRLADSPQIEYIEKPKELAYFVEQGKRASCITPVQQASPNLTGKGVLIGIIDSGIDYFHPDFKKEDGTTRIVSLLDIGGMGSSLDETEYSRDQINQALLKSSKEEGLQIVPSEDIIGHGTHVTGIAASNGKQSNGTNQGVAYNSELIIVKLGRDASNPRAKTTEIMRGIDYIIETARSLNKPVAINISYGNNDGSHDGSSLFETYIDGMANQWKNVIVIGSGNEGASAHHYKNRIQEDEVQEVEIVVGPSEDELWIQLWKSFTDSFLIEIVAPNGQRTGFIKPMLGAQEFMINQTKTLLYFGEPSPYDSDQEIFFVLMPTNENIGEGVWKIRIQAEKVVKGEYDLWLPISSGLNPFTKFLNPDVTTTLTVPSTATKVISVGGYNPSNNSIASFSGRGYTRDVGIVKPNLVAPAVDIMSTVPGGGYDTMSGTSMATPFVTGAAALLMEWGIVKGNDPFLYGEKVKAILQKSANRDPVRSYPDPAWGYGTLCLKNAFESSLTTASISGQQTSCEDVIYSEDYLDIIIEYTEDLEARIEQFQPECTQIINDQFAILHIHSSDCGKYASYLPILLGTSGTSAMSASGILVFHNQPYVPLRGQGVLVGIVDTGIDYLQDAFLYEDKTSKISFLWDQTIRGNPPEGFQFGTEYSREIINQAISSENPYEIVPSRDEVGHGTFLAGIAAGREKLEADFIGAAPDSELIVVKLKPAKKCLMEYNLINQSNSSVFQSNDLMLGVKYLLEKSKELRKPISIIIGLGSNQGAHDGSSMLESYLLDVAKRQGNVVTVAAGNEANLSHHYYTFFMKNEKEKSIEVNVAKDEAGFMLNIWSNAPDKISIAITSPTGEYIGRIPARIEQTEEIKLVLENTRLTIIYDLTEERTGDQRIRIRMEEPTEGIWTITVFGDLIVDGRIDAWLPREGFVKPETTFLMPSAYTTVTVPSTSIGLITAGGYNHVTGSLYLGSSRGLTRDLELKPDLVAPAVNVIGPLPGNRFGALTGTSVGAAITAGASALLLEWGIINKNDVDMDTEKVRNYLIRGATRKDSISYPNREWGYGELNLFGTFEALKGYKS